MVACDGGGGPAGHPRIFINTDKPEIAVCGYCGLPFVGLPFAQEAILNTSEENELVNIYGRYEGITNEYY